MVEGLWCKGLRVGSLRVQGFEGVKGEGLKVYGSRVKGLWSRAWGRGVGFRLQRSGLRACG